jgi:hypothetical protein
MRMVCFPRLLHEPISFPPLRGIPALVVRFVRPEPAGYDALRHRFAAVRAFWRRHRLAETVDPSFALCAS